MHWMKLAKATGAVAAAALLIAGCSNSDETEAAATTDAAAEGAADASASATDAAAEPAAPEPPAAVSYVGSWVQTDDPAPTFLSLQEGGRVTHNEPGLADGRWEQAPDGGVIITFTGQQTVRITGSMQGDSLVLTLPDGETGRFARSSAAAAPSRGGQDGGQNSGFGQGGGQNSGFGQGNSGY